ncbi:MAG: efflux RND transporter periplasmic adaptor subunit [Taibaiella sp.]|nr:efflux RND transporter periplasmic adaptor subunit [Taibaiella sp.]
MKRSYLFLVPAIVLASCGGANSGGDLASLKKQRAEIDAKIKTLEASSKDTTGGKTTAVSVLDLQPTTFNAFIEVQSQITGDEVVNATARSQGVISSIYVHVGQHVSRGQVLGTLDASVIDQQIAAMEPQIDLLKALYEKQQKLWAQDIGTEVALMKSKSDYEAMMKQKAALKAQRDLNNIISPISGTVDFISMKVGDPSSLPTAFIRVVNTASLKAEANLGENYLGKVNVGDKATLIFPDDNDSMNTKISYVSKAVDPLSRAFMVQIKLGSDKRLHPNMSCIMRISNYEKKDAIVVPVSVIQKTAEGDMVYVVDGGTAHSKMIKTGRNSNGKVEVLEGLSAGDKLVVAGFEDLDNDEKVTIE